MGRDLGVDVSVAIGVGMHFIGADGVVMLRMLAASTFCGRLWVGFAAFERYCAGRCTERCYSVLSA